MKHYEDLKFSAIDLLSQLSTSLHVTVNARTFIDSLKKEERLKQSSDRKIIFLFALPHFPGFQLINRQVCVLQSFCAMQRKRLKTGCSDFVVGSSFEYWQLHDATPCAINQVQTARPALSRLQGFYLIQIIFLKTKAKYMENFSTQKQNSLK